MSTYMLIKYYQPIWNEIMSFFLSNTCAWMVRNQFEQTCIDRLPRRKWFWWKHRLYVFRVNSFLYKLLKAWITFGFQSVFAFSTISAWLSFSRKVIPTKSNKDKMKNAFIFICTYLQNIFKDNLYNCQEKIESLNYILWDLENVL